MNVLIVDDIKLTGESLKEGLSNLLPDSSIYFLHYNVEISENENIITICERIKNNDISVLLLDRGYSKIYEDSEDEFVYSSISEADRNLRVRSENLLCNNNGLLERLSSLDTKLSSVLLYTYDIGDINIDNVIQKIKVDVQVKLSQLNFHNILFQVFETSTVFKKPTNTLIYPDSFYLNAKYKDSFIDYGKKTRNIGTKLAYKEYGQLMSHIIVDLIRQKGNNNIYDFSNPGNRDFDSFLRSLSRMQISNIQERHEYYVDKNGNPAVKKADDSFTPIKLRPSTVSVIFNFQGIEKYYIDIPYKEYYDSLNDDITEDLIHIFKKKNGEYKKGEFVYYSYNYLSDLRAYQLYNIKVSAGLAQEVELAKKWLPFLHCGLFHLNQPILWESPTIIEDNSYEGEKIGLFFFIDTIEIDEFKGHINYTFYEESDRKFGISEIENSAKLILDNISPILKSKATDVLIPKLKDLLLFEATRAAISQVMARNTSHNIGAHVMNKLIGEFDYAKLFRYTYDSTRFSELYKKTVEKWNKERIDAGKANLTPEEENQKILLDQISIFNNYVKCRMDYLADISFGTPLMQTNKYVYGELYIEFDKVRLLLEHISGLDDFKFKIEFKRNGKEFQKDEKGNILNDLLVAIPNDILGTQAFYNILENIIRNTAKHSNKETLGNKQQVIFTVNFIDEAEESKDYKNAINRNEIDNVLTEFIAVEVYDNIPVEGLGRPLTKEEKDEYYNKMKKRDLDKFPLKIDALVFNQNSKLNDDILSKENKIRSYSLGLVEMDASAAYLRKRPVEYINHKSYDIHYDEWWSRDTEVNEGDKEKRGTNCRHFLKAFKKTVEINDEKGNREENYLAYRFFLHRPAVVLVVTNELENDKVKRDKLQKEGIWVITPEKFEQELKNDKVYPHEFVVYATENKMIETLFSEHKTSLPVRTIEFANCELVNLLVSQDLEDNKLLAIWEQLCWEKWYNLLKQLYDIKGEIIINTSFECNSVDNNFNAVLLDHGQKTWKSFNTCKNVDYMDGLSSKAQDKIPGRKKYQASYPDFEKNFVPNIYKLQLERNKLRESVRAKILVIDERVQNQIEIIFHDDIKFLEVYAKSGIIIPDSYNKVPYFIEDSNNISYSKFNLAANNIDEEYGNSLIQYIEHYASILKKTDFILIHYSILERVFEKQSSKTKAINNYLNKISKQNGPQIVITSGRGGGALKELTPKVRFVNLSSVITSFVEIKSKYFSNYLLHSSRKNNDIN